jgi:Mg2+ and Co2+ transporter CorA
LVDLSSRSALELTPRERAFGSKSQLIAAGGFFWLDLDRPVPEDFEILRDAFGFRPLAIEDSRQFDHRAARLVLVPAAVDSSVTPDQRRLFP